MIHWKVVYTIASVNLAVLLVLMLTPSGVGDSNTTLGVYGIAELTKRDVTGNEVFSHIIHNRLVDSGEQAIIDELFGTGNYGPANWICITDNLGARGGQVGT